MYTSNCIKCYLQINKRRRWRMHFILNANSFCKLMEQTKILALIDYLLTVITFVAQRKC